MQNNLGIQKGQEQEKKQKQPKSYLLLHNVGKRKNVGTIVRSACAFNIDTVFLITGNAGKKKYSIEKDFNFFGNHGTTKQMNFYAFNDLKQSKEYFKQKGIKVCGVEITKDAKSVVDHPFEGDTVFIMGNEVRDKIQGTGMNQNQKNICDQFIYIPQYTDKTASLNVAVSASIIFHHFAVWAQFKESKMFDNEKYQVERGVIGNGGEEEEEAVQEVEEQKSTEQKNANKGIKIIYHDDVLGIKGKEETDEQLKKNSEEGKDIDLNFMMEDDGGDTTLQDNQNNDKVQNQNKEIQK